jgi:hypothetical protein
MSAIGASLAMDGEREPTWMYLWRPLWKAWTVPPAPDGQQGSLRLRNAAALKKP